VETETADIGDRLKPVTFDDFDVINGFLKKHPSEKCDFNVCNIFTWELVLQIEFAFYHDRLILFNPCCKYLWAPVGDKLSAGELLQLYRSLGKKYENVEILGVSEEYIAGNPELGEYFSITNDENLNDYIYSTEDLVKLPGKKLGKKKNLISQFMRLYTDFTVKPVEINDYDEIMEFCYYWRKTHEVDSENLDIEFEAIKAILTHWDLLPCDGLKLYAGGKICAFSIFSPQTADMATVHFEKYDFQIKGAGQVINHETAKVLAQRFKYVNREQDMGSPGIRQAKRSYQPVRMLPYYRLKKS